MSSLDLLFRRIHRDGTTPLLIVFVIACLSVFSIRRVFGYLLGRNGVISAGKKGVTSENPFYRKPEAHKKATFLKCLKGIGRACRGKPACRISFERRQNFSVKANQPNANILHFVVFSCFESAEDLSASVTNISSFEKA